MSEAMALVGDMDGVGVALAQAGGKSMAWGIV